MAECMHYKHRLDPMGDIGSGELCFTVLSHWKAVEPYLMFPSCASVEFAQGQAVISQLKNVFPFWPGFKPNKDSSMHFEKFNEDAYRIFTKGMCIIVPVHTFPKGAR